LHSQDRLRQPLPALDLTTAKSTQKLLIWTDQLLLAENGSDKISVLTVQGDKARVVVNKESLKTPTEVEPVGNTIWIAERGAGKAVSIPIPK